MTKINLDLELILDNHYLDAICNCKYHHTKIVYRVQYQTHSHNLNLKQMSANTPI